MATLTITEGRSPRRVYQTLEKLAGEELKKCVEIWHGKYLPQHFSTGAAKRYGYQARDLAYNRSKRRRYGHDKPLVKTGAAMRSVATSIRLSSKRMRSKGVIRANGVMPAPRYMYITQRTSKWNYRFENGKWKRDGRPVGTKTFQPFAELVKTLPQEEAYLAVQFKKLLRGRLKEASPKQVRRYYGR